MANKFADRKPPIDIGHEHFWVVDSIFILFFFEIQNIVAQIQISDILTGFPQSMR